MKKELLFWLVVFLLPLVGCDESDISKKDADNIAKHYVEKNIEPSTDRYAVYYFNRLDVNHVKFVFWSNDELVVENAFIYFIDEDCQANWGHPCRLMSIDKSTGKHKIYHRNEPPTAIVEGLTDDSEVWTLWIFGKECNIE